MRTYTLLSGVEAERVRCREPLAEELGRAGYTFEGAVAYEAYGTRKWVYSVFRSPDQQRIAVLVKLRRGFTSVTFYDFLEDGYGVVTERASFLRMLDARLGGLRLTTDQRTIEAVSPGLSLADHLAVHEARVARIAAERNSVPTEATLTRYLAQKRSEWTERKDAEISPEAAVRNGGVAIVLAVVLIVAIVGGAIGVSPSMSGGAKVPVGVWAAFAAFASIFLGIAAVVARGRSRAKVAVVPKAAETTGEALVFRGRFGAFKLGIAGLLVLAVGIGIANVASSSWSWSFISIFAMAFQIPWYVQEVFASARGKKRLVAVTPSGVAEVSRRRIVAAPRAKDTRGVHTVHLLDERGALLGSLEGSEAATDRALATLGFGPEVRQRLPLGFSEAPRLLLPYLGLVGAVLGGRESLVLGSVLGVVGIFLFGWFANRPRGELTVGADGLVFQGRFIPWSRVRVEPSVLGKPKLTVEGEPALSRIAFLQPGSIEVVAAAEKHAASAVRVAETVKARILVQGDEAYRDGAIGVDELEEVAQDPEAPESVRVSAAKTLSVRPEAESARARVAARVVHPKVRRASGD